MSILILLLVVVFLFGGGSYFYGSGGAYPYRSFAFPGIGALLVIILVLYLLHVI